MKELSLHITDRCSFRCVFCVWGESLVLDHDPVSFNELAGFLEDHRDQGYERVNLHGGEPTMRHDLLELMRLIRSLGYGAISLQSNGWALSSRAFTQRLVEAGVDLFIISVHGPSPEIHDTLSGANGSLDRIRAGMAHITELGQRIRTNTVITRPNLEHLAETAAWVVGHGASEVNLSTLMPSGRAQAADPEMMPSYREIAPHISQAAAVIRERGATLRLEGLPCCIAPQLAHLGVRRSASTGHQITCFIRGEVWANHDSYVEQHLKSKRQACHEGCALEHRCGGVYSYYTQVNGWQEFQPITTLAH